MRKMGSFVYSRRSPSCTVALKCFAQAATNFLLSSAENTKKSHVLHFNNHNPGSKHDLYHFLNILTPFFPSTLSALSVGLSQLCITKTSKFHFRGPPFALCSGLYNTYLLANDNTMKPITL